MLDLDILIEMSDYYEVDLRKFFVDVIAKVK